MTATEALAQQDVGDRRIVLAVAQVSSISPSSDDSNTILVSCASSPPAPDNGIPSAWAAATSSATTCRSTTGAADATACVFVLPVIDALSSTLDSYTVVLTSPPG